MLNLDTDLLADLYLNQKLSILNISKRLNQPLSTIRCRLLSSGVKLRTHKEAASNFKGWGKWLIGKKMKPFTKEHRQRISQARLKSNQFKGTTLKPSGYLEYTRGINKYRGVHVVMMEEHLHRSMLPNEVVHHKNGIRNDNRIDNLEVMTRSNHTRFHRLKERKNYEFV